MLRPRTLPGSEAHDGSVVVCGGGAAGLAAALAAARRGARVLLLEAGPQLGGTVANALIHTLAGFYDAAGEVMNDGLPAELLDRLLHADPSARRRKMGRLWVLNVCPTIYRDTVTRWIATERQIAVLCKASVTRAVRRGNSIVELEFATRDGTFPVRPAAVIDATGTAEVVRLIDRSLVMDDEGRSAGGWIFRLRGVAPGALDFPKGVGIVRLLRAAAKAGDLPAECAHAWLDSGVYPDETFVKLMVPHSARWRDPAHHREITARAQQTQAAVLEFLTLRPDFAGAYTTQTGTLGVRDGGRICGRYVLTGDDVRQGRTFHDSFGRCAWPIEFWDPERGVSIEHLPPGACYEIPMRCLQLTGIQNLWVAGKCLSADREAQASARVVGACWAMGEAAGSAAAIHRVDTCEAYHESEPLRAVSSDRAAPAR